MAQFFNDFAQYPLDTKLDGGAYDWAVLSGQTDYTFQVIEDARGAGGRVLRIVRGGFTGATWWRWASVPIVSSGEMYIENIAGTAGNTAAGSRLGTLRLMANANSNATQGYFGGDNSGGSANVTPGIRRVDTPSTAGAVGDFYAFESNRKRSQRFRWTDLGSSVLLQYKTWWSDGVEPGEWSVEANSATVASAPYWASGVVGIGRLESAAIESRLTFIGVGTDGDPAPTAPIGPAERQRSRLILTPW